jgi:sulfur carrier protein ThiS
MQIKIKLMGTLREKEPIGEYWEVPPGATIRDVLDKLEISSDSVQVFTVNGQLVRDQDHELHEGDELTVLPPVGGG